MNLLDEYVNKRILSIYAVENVLLTEIVTKEVIPPIKGIITSGKLKWRGLRLILHKDKMWIEQRGKIVGNIINRITL